MLRYRFSGSATQRVLSLVASLLTLASGHGYGQGAQSGRAVESPVSPGDRLYVQIWQEPDLSGEFVVDERGEVILPKLGTLSVEHRSAADVRDLVRLAYAEFLRNPAITVRVLRRVTVNGEVNKPGLYTVDTTYSLRDLLAEAGGISGGGDSDRIELTRDGVRTRFSLSESERLAATGLRSGDFVYVRKSHWLKRNWPGVVSSGVGLLSLIITLSRS